VRAAWRALLLISRAAAQIARGAVNRARLRSPPPAPGSSSSSACARDIARCAQLRVGARGMELVVF